MFALIIYNDKERTTINCIYLFSSIKEIIKFTRGMLKYQDIKKNRKYKTFKSFFEVVEF
jgi:hypothetical protein